MIGVIPALPAILVETTAIIVIVHALFREAWRWWRAKQSLRTLDFAPDDFEKNLRDAVRVPQGRLTA